MLNVWKNVRRYAQDGFTSVIHGKVHHEETRATASQATQYPNGHFLIVRDEAEAEIACDFIRARRRCARPSSRASARRVSAGFDPIAHLERIGCANQTTMLMTRVAGDRRDVPRGDDRPLRRRRRWPQRFRAFDTICSATQERQDAVVALLDAQPLDLAVVIGGYNSSNTCNLARICAERVPTFHIADPDCLVSADEIRHRPIGAPSTAAVAERTHPRLAPGRPADRRPDGRRLDPNNIVGQVIERLEALTSA